MLYFLYGKNTYHLKEKLYQIIEKYKKVHQGTLSLERFDLEQNNLKEVLDNLKQGSLFVQKKLFILENMFFDQEILKQVDTLVGSVHIIVLIETKEVKKTDKLFKALLKKAKTQEFKELSSLQINNWLKKQFNNYDTAVNSLALFRLASIFKADVWGLSNAVRLLSCYAKNITEKEIDLFFTQSTKTDIFKTIESIAQKNKNKALSCINIHLANGENVLYLLSMVAYQFRNLVLAKQGQLKAHPFVVKKSEALAYAFSLEQLKNTYQQIMLTDYNIKMGIVVPEEALRDLVLFI